MMNGNQQISTDMRRMHMTMIADAYSHIGLPRYGGLEDYVKNMESFRIRKSVMVLAKTIPDFSSLFAGIHTYPQTIRGIGIPFGRTDQQRLEMVNIQIKAGVLGFRIEPDEMRANPDILRLLGEQGKWVFAISPLKSDDICNACLEWLDQYPHANIASPHLLYAESVYLTLRQSKHVRDLLRHPRFHVIFSRHGGTGSNAPYPHSDFLPWLTFVFDQVNIGRIMWGSEYPVFYSRNELMPKCISWLEEIDAGLTEQQLRAVMHDNTDRVFFTEQAPGHQQVTIPDWVVDQFDQQQTVKVFYNYDGLELPLDIYGKLLNDYLQSEEWRGGNPFSKYFENKLALMLKSDRRK